VFCYQGGTNLLVGPVLWASAEMTKMKVDDIGGIPEKLRNEAQIRTVKMKALKISGNSQICVAPDEKEILVQGGHLGGQRFCELIVAVGVSDADSQTAGVDAPALPQTPQFGSRRANSSKTASSLFRPSERSTKSW
jgi:hypothetical protein